MSDPVTILDKIVDRALAARASDIHLEPTSRGYSLRLRVDGALREVECLDAAVGRALVNRLMVLASLLTYRLDVPQEGRINWPASPKPLDVRLAVIPTIHGIRAVLRLPAELIAPRTLQDLHLHPDALTQLQRFAASDFGMLICCGPAGSGKTTTLYAILQHILKIAPDQSIITLEDPVERSIDGITQIEVSPFGQMTYDKALRSILRQDPQVLMIGEIRDPQTASLAFQAALTGHRLLCTLHAPSPAGAVARLLEMNIEPYQIASALAGVLALRLVPARNAGRVPLCQWVEIDAPLRAAILAQSGPDALAKAISQQTTHVSFATSAQWLATQSLTP